MSKVIIQLQSGFYGSDVPITILHWHFKKCDIYRTLPYFSSCSKLVIKHDFRFISLICKWKQRDISKKDLQYLFNTSFTLISSLVRYMNVRYTWTDMYIMYMNVRYTWTDMYMNVRYTWTDMYMYETGLSCMLTLMYHSKG